MALTPEEIRNALETALAQKREGDREHVIRSLLQMVRSDLGMHPKSEEIKTFLHSTLGFGTTVSHGYDVTKCVATVHDDRPDEIIVRITTRPR